MTVMHVCYTVSAMYMYNSGLLMAFYCPLEFLNKPSILGKRFWTTNYFTLMELFDRQTQNNKLHTFMHSIPDQYKYNSIFKCD